MVKTRGIDSKNYKEDDDEVSQEGDTTLSYASSASSSSSEQPDDEKSPSASTRKSAITKKRPYRRTRRPAGYNDKSSITTTTETFQPVSAYDAVLQESQDLCQAAAEAQQLGRLKMSAAYLLLLHTRLVGLGKRFDKAIAVAERGEDAASPSKRESSQKAAQEELARLLPTNIELDTAMMEHLARAAAELHAARTGKSHSLTSPTAREFLAGTANQQGVTNAATVTGVAKAVAAIEQQEAQYWNSNNNNNKKGGGGGDNSKSNAATVEEVDELLKYMPGRNKPATTAMRTVPHANCDAKSLLFGAAFQANSQSSSHSSSLASGKKKQKTGDDNDNTV